MIEIRWTINDKLVRTENQDGDLCGREDVILKPVDMGSPEEPFWCHVIEGVRYPRKVESEDDTMSITYRNV